jgi:hypothetical protein
MKNPYEKFEAQGTALLNEPVIASVLVNPINSNSLAGQLANGVIGGGLVYGVAAEVVHAVRDRKKAPPPVKLLPHMLLSVSNTQIALFELKQGFFKSSLGEVLFKAPKEEVKIELGVKTKSIITHGIAIETDSGARIELECHFRLKKLAGAVQEALNK